MLLEQVCRTDKLQPAIVKEFGFHFEAKGSVRLYCMDIGFRIFQPRNLSSLWR